MAAIEAQNFRVISTLTDEQRTHENKVQREVLMCHAIIWCEENRKSAGAAVIKGLIPKEQCKTLQRRLKTRGVESIDTGQPPPDPMKVARTTAYLTVSRHI